MAGYRMVTQYEITKLEEFPTSSDQPLQPTAYNENCQLSIV